LKALAVVTLAACWTSAQDPPAPPRAAPEVRAKCSRERLVVRVVDDEAHEPLPGATVVFGGAQERVDEGVLVEVSDEAGTVTIAPVPAWISFVVVYYGDHEIKASIPRSICGPVRVVVPTSEEK